MVGLAMELELKLKLKLKLHLEMPRKLISRITPGAPVTTGAMMSCGFFFSVSFVLVAL